MIYTVNMTCKERIGKNIKLARVAAGKTQRELENAIGMKGGGGGAYVCRVEAGEITPGGLGMMKIAQALGVNVGELLT